MAIRVFLVEDSPRTRDLVRDILDVVGGFELVGMAADETSATEWLMNHRNGWDLAVLDLLLQHGTGFTLITRCSREAGSVLVFSDFVSPAVRQRCMRLGADGVLSKEDFGQLRSYLERFRQHFQQGQAA